ncbi:hypothetical protein LINPERHAP2_LOCUS25393 [Linum perenne]
MKVVRQIVDHSLVKNTTQILHLLKNLHLSRIAKISLVLSFLSLVVACASASVTDLLLSAGGSFCPPKVETLRENNIDEEDFKMIQANE